MRLKLLIADDHQLMLDAIRMALDGTEDMEIVGETTSGAQVLPLVRNTSPDVVLLDCGCRGLDGLAASRHSASATRGQGHRAVGT